MEQTKELLTTKEAANFLRISVPSLWRLRRKGQLCARKVLGKTIFRLSDLREFIDNAKEELTKN